MLDLKRLSSVALRNTLEYGLQPEPDLKIADVGPDLTSPFPFPCPSLLGFVAPFPLGRGDVDFERENHWLLEGQYRTKKW